MARVLVVDDAATIRLYHRRVLERAGYEVDEAVNGLEALEKALSGGYDLYVVDVNMPQMDGFSFVRRLRGLQGVKQVPVVVVSTEGDERDRQAALDAGANYYLVKPAKPQELASLAALLTGGCDDTVA